MNRVMILQAMMILVLSSKILSRKTQAPKTPPSFRFTFGSCFRDRKFFVEGGSDIFLPLKSLSPDVFVWLGDFAYLDIFKGISFRHDFNSEEEMRRRFDESFYDKNYTKFRESGVKIFGVWDDHDSGINDSGKHNKVKELVRQIFLDYFDVPKNSTRRTQPDGMYGSYYVDEKKYVKLILLDVRYSADDYFIAKEGGEKCNLGEKQKEWLRREVEESTARYTIIGSGDQILPDDRYNERF